MKLRQIISEAIDMTIAQKWVDEVLEEGNYFLSQYGLSVVFNPKYNFEANEYYKTCIAIYQNGSVKNKGRISISINFPYLEKCIKKRKYEEEVRKSIWHEIGHGLLEYLKGLRRKDTQCGTNIFRGRMLKDFKYIIYDEEESVEEFAYRMADPYSDASCLIDFLQDYENEILTLRNQEGGSKWLDYFRQK